MKQEIKLFKKVKRLLRRLGMPRWLHRYGPKTYEFFEHLAALLMRFFNKLSYVRVVQLFDLLGIRCPGKSALQATAAKLDSAFWQRVLKLTCGASYLVAIDSTCFSRTNPSYHYLKRIDGKIPKVPVKLSFAYDTRKKKFCAAKIRVLKAHDIRDAKPLLEKSNPKIGVLDKAYKSEKLNEYAYERKIVLMVPKKSNEVSPGFFTKKMNKTFRTRTYHRRELAESGNSSTKRKYGSSVSSRKVRTIRTELYGRLTCHNLFLWFNRLSGRSRFIQKLYILQQFIKYHHTHYEQEGFIMANKKSEFFEAPRNPRGDF
jgi:hypothetical protein